MHIVQLRTYLDRCTTSKVFVNGIKTGEALEDPGRPLGVKLPGVTCIPEGIYWARLTYSPKFKKDMIVLFNVKSDHSIRHGTARWDGIRVHPGRTVDHTDACVLYGERVEGEILHPGGLDALEYRVRNAQSLNEDIYWIIAGEPV